VKQLHPKAWVKFLNSIDFSQDEFSCFMWRGRIRRDGYGEMIVERKHLQAHRISYSTFVGFIPTGQLVLHRCDVKSCVNPRHLFLGTQSDNMRDCAAKGRINKRSGNEKKIECPKGHPYTPENTAIYRGWRYCITCRDVRNRKKK